MRLMCAGRIIGRWRICCRPSGMDIRPSTTQPLNHLSKVAKGGLGVSEVRNKPLFDVCLFHPILARDDEG